MDGDTQCVQALMTRIVDKRGHRRGRSDSHGRESQVKLSSAKGEAKGAECSC